MTNRKQQTRPDLQRWRGEFVCVTGKVAAFVVEESHDPRKVDHVWIDVYAGESGLIRVSLNTCSLKNRDAGFDSRVRLGIVTSLWSEAPGAGVRICPPLDYAVIERANAIPYVEHDQRALEALLLDKAGRAVAVEAWGEFYMQAAAGIHQLHSRRGSYGLPKDVVGRDGAIQFYFGEGNYRELLLFKFAGQP